MFTYDIQATDIDGDAITYSIVIISGDASYDLTDTQLTVTPDLDWNGDVQVTVAVFDGELADSDSFALTVNPINDAPYFITDSLDNAIEDSYYTYTISVSDTDDTIEEVIINESPDWVQINSFELSGTPTVDDIGTFQINLSISDGENVTSEIFDLVIESVNDAPISEDATFTTNEDQILDVILIANDEETPDDLEFNIIDEPLHGTLTSSRSLGFFTYTPDLNYNGSDSFTFVASDLENSSNTSTVTISISPINDVPYFITEYNELDSALEDSEYSFILVYDDIDNDNSDLILSSQYLPSWLTLDGNTLTGTPTDIIDNLNIEITLTLEDLESSVSNNFIVNVIAINNSPIAYSQSLFLLEDESLQIFLNGSDPEDDPLTFTVVDEPLFGTLSMDDLEQYVIYVPDANHNGQDSFTFKSFDGSLYSDNSETITLTITEVNDAPYVASIDNIEVPLNASVIIELENYIGDYDDHANTLNITFLPEGEDESTVGSTFYGGTITALGSYEYEYTPSSTNTPLEDFIVYKVSDGQLESEPALISFDIPWGRPGIFRPGPNSAVPQFMDTAEDTQTEVTFISFNSDPLDDTNDFPEDGDGVFVEIVWGPFHGEIDPSAISLDDASGDYTIMSGGYIPGNNYGDNPGIDEVLRPTEDCGETGLDSLAYIVYNPEIDEYTDETVITFCIHGVNDPPLLFDILDKTFDEDNILQIPIVISQDTSDIVINSEYITAFDPDISYNTLDVEINSSTLSGDLSVTISNDSLFIITPNNNINGSYQIDIIARENYDLHESCGTCPNPPLEDVKSFNITINSINDAPSVCFYIGSEYFGRGIINYRFKRYRCRWRYRIYL